MIAMSVDKLKIVIELHEGEKSTKKVWRFNVAEHYSKSKLEHEIEGLIPHITNKGLKLNLYHNDELAGKVCIESDADATEELSRILYLYIYR